MRRIIFSGLIICLVTSVDAQEWDDPITTSDWGQLWKSSFIQSINASNAPESSGWFWGLNMNHSSNSSSYRYNGQIAIKNSYLNPTLYFRSTDVNGNGTWTKVIHNTGDQELNGKLKINGLIQGGFGASSTSGVTDWNDISNSKSGSGYTLLLGNATNGPGIGNYFHPFNFEYNHKDGSGNITQLAIPYGDGNSIERGVHMRGRYNGVWSNWVKLISEDLNGNVGIGTSSPTYAKLQIKGGATHELFAVNRPNSEVPALYLGNAGNNDAAIAANNSNLTFGKDFGGTYTEYMRVQINTGNVGIGTTSPDNKLDVAGTIRAEEVKVESTPWPDYVFSDTYQLNPLSEVSTYIQKNHHLPGIPTAEEVAENGIKLGEMNAKLLEKVEELTLYLIEKDKEILDLKKRMNKLENQ